MGSDVFWIKLQTNTFDSETIMLLESMPEGDTILIIWFKMQILAGWDSALAKADSFTEVSSKASSLASGMDLIFQILNMFQVEICGMPLVGPDPRLADLRDETDRRQITPGPGLDLGKEA